MKILIKTVLLMCFIALSILPLCLGDDEEPAVNSVSFPTLTAAEKTRWCETLSIPFTITVADGWEKDGSVIHSGSGSLQGGNVDFSGAGTATISQNFIKYWTDANGNKVEEDSDSKTASITVTDGTVSLTLTGPTPAVFCKGETVYAKQQNMKNGVKDGDAIDVLIDTSAAGANLEIKSNEYKVGSCVANEQKYKYTIVEIIQFNIDRNKHPGGLVCKDSSLDKSDFIIQTNPNSYADSANVVSPTDTIGPEVATLTVAGCEKTAGYTVIESGEWIPVSNIPHPATSLNISTTSVSTDVDYGIVWNDTYVTTATWSGGYVWELIGTDIVGPAGTFKTTKSKKWGLTTSVAGEAGVDIPMVGSAKITVTVGGSWETSTTHELNSGPGGGGYSWRYAHYQEVVGLSRTVSSTKSSYNTITGSSTPAAPYSHSGFTGTYPLPICGSNNYLQTEEKRCQ